MFIVALAQPRLVKGESQIKASGVDIVVAIDMSGSMRSEDFGEGQSRIKLAKEVPTSPPR
jgi:Ca-activated chloride channel homolog